MPWIPTLMTCSAEEATELRLDRAGLDTNTKAATSNKPLDHADERDQEDGS
jgi:propanediol dehydratase large subunit